MKAQLLVSLDNEMIYGVYCGKGRQHDFKLYKDSKVRIPPQIKMLADSGYQGIQEFHSNSNIPIKKTKDKKLTPAEKKYNHELSKKRIIVENIIRRCKIFKITKDVYRGKHKNHGKVWNLVSGLVNIRYSDLLI